MFWTYKTAAVLIFFALISFDVYPPDPVYESFTVSNSAPWSLSMEHSYFSESLDVIDYLHSLEGTSRPETYSQSAFSIAYQFETWRPFIEYREVSGSVERSSQPFLGGI